MISECWVLQKALFSVLQQEVHLEPYLGKPMRLYDSPPQEIIFPFVTFGKWESKSIGGIQAPLKEQRLSLHVWSRYGGRREVHEVIAILEACLQDRELTLEIGRLVNLRCVFSDVFRSGDGFTIHGVLRIRAVTEPEEQEHSLKGK